MLEPVDPDVIVLREEVDGWQTDPRQDMIRKACGFRVVKEFGVLFHQYEFEDKADATMFRLKYSHKVLADDIDSENLTERLKARLRHGDVRIDSTTGKVRKRMDFDII